MPYEMGTIDQRHIMKTLDAIMVDAWESTDPLVKAFRTTEEDKRSLSTSSATPRRRWLAFPEQLDIIAETRQDDT